MNVIIWLNNLELKAFTEQDALDYCQINDINPDNITVLSLFNNKLTDISGVKLFKNLNELNLFNNLITDISVFKYLTELKKLFLGNNKIKDISAIQYLNNLEILNIEDLKLQSDQLKYIQSLNNIQRLYCKNGFKDMNILNELKKNIIIYKY